MATWFASPTGSDTGPAPGTTGSPLSLNRVAGQVAGQSKPAAGDVVELMGTYYPQRLVLNVSSSGAQILFRSYPAGGQTAVIEQRQNAGPNSAPSPLVSWSGPTTISYGGGFDSGENVWYKDVGGDVYALFIDAYPAGVAPAGLTWKRVSAWNMRVYDYNNAGILVNPNKRIHESDEHTSGTDQVTWSSFGTRVSTAHDRWGQYHHDVSGAFGTSGRLYLRPTSTGSMAGGSPAHTIHYCLNNEQTMYGNGVHGLRFENIQVRGGKRGIEFHNCNNITLKNVDVRYTAHDGIQFTNCQKPQILGCVVFAGTPAQHLWGGVLLQNCADTLIDQGTEIAFGGHHLIENEGSVNTVLRYCYLHHGPYAFNGRKGASGLLMEHNEIEFCGRVDDTDIHKTGHGVVVLGNNTTGAVIRRNRIYACGHFIIKQDKGASGSQIHNNSGRVEYNHLRVEDFVQEQAGQWQNNHFKNNSFEELGDPAGTIENKAFFLQMAGATANNGYGNRIENNCAHAPAIGDDDLVLALNLGDPSATELTIAEADAAGTWVGTVFSNNQDADPNFVNSDDDDRATRDFGLNVGSPCLNSGTSSGISGTLVKNGVSYPDHPAASGTIDQGAFEGTDDGEGGGGPPPAGQAPTLNLVASLQTVNVGDTVQFTANGDDPDGAESALEYDWDFGDPNDAGQFVSGTGKATYDVQNFTFTQPGFYIVAVTVTDEEDLTAQDSVGIQVNSTRGGTLRTDFSGWSAVSSGTGGVDHDFDGDGTPDSTPDKLYDQAFDNPDERWARSGVIANPQTATLSPPSALADPVTQTVLWPYRAAEGRQHVITARWSDDGGETWNNIHPGATWKTLVGPNNPRTIIDHEPLVGLTDFDLTEHSNSEGSNYATFREVQFLQNVGGGSPPQEIAIPILEVWADDHEGLHTADRAANGVKPNALRPLETWRAYSVDAQPAWYCRRDTTDDLKHLDLWLYWGESRTETFNVATAADAAAVAANNWTSRLTAQTSATGQQKTRLTLSAATTDEYVRITVTACQFGKTAEIAEVELFGE